MYVLRSSVLWRREKDTGVTDNLLYELWSLTTFEILDQCKMSQNLRKWPSTCSTCHGTAGFMLPSEKFKLISYQVEIHVRSSEGGGLIALLHNFVCMFSSRFICYKTKMRFSSRGPQYRWKQTNQLKNKTKNTPQKHLEDQTKMPWYFTCWLASAAVEVMVSYWESQTSYGFIRRDTAHVVLHYSGTVLDPTRLLGR